MRKMMMLTALLLALALVSSAVAEPDNAAQLAFDSNPTTGYTWTAFVLYGDSVELPDDGEYVSDQTGMLAGAGGQTFFTLHAVKPGLSLVRFAYGRPWESEIAEQRLILAHVDEDVRLTWEDVTESGIIEGVVLSVDADGHSALLSTEKLGEVVAQFDEEMALPVQDERVIVYTSGVMTMSLPAIVNALAWESVPSELARGEGLPTFEELTGFSALAGRAIVSAFYSDGTEMNVHFTTEEPEEIQALLDAVAQLEIDSVSNMMVTDWYPLLQFTLSDGETWSLGFDGHWLEEGMENYVLKNDQAFWRLIDQLERKYAEEE